MKAGDRVELTRSALAQGLQGRGSRTGVVKSIVSDADRSITVLRDGRKRTETWHRRFWRKVADPSVGASDANDN